MKKTLNEDDIREIATQNSFNLTRLVEDIQYLRHKITESEERVSLRLLDVLKKVLTEQGLEKSYDEVSKKVLGDNSLDMFEIERAIAAQAKEKALAMQEVLDAAIEFKSARQELSELGLPLLPTTEDVSYQNDLQLQVIVKREKLFSSLFSYDLRKSRKELDIQSFL